MISKEDDILIYIKEKRDEVRTLSIDLVKAIAILLVIWGHMIQYLHGTEYDYWNNMIFKWIYGFHMPAFALVSGFLYAKSRKTGVCQAFEKKTKQLLLPVISWALLLSILDYFLIIFLHKDHVGGGFADRFISRCLNDLWFLKGIFLCYLLVMFVEMITSKIIIRYLLLFTICISTLFWPKSFRLPLYAFLVPYYIIGFGVEKNMNDLKQLDKKNNKKLIMGSIVLIFLYFFLSCLYQEHDYIYSSGISIINSQHGIWGQIRIDLFRFITGLAGCMMIVSICCVIQSMIPKYYVEWITKISSSTLSIYAITASFFVYLPQIMLRLNITDISLRVHIFDLCCLLPLSLIMMRICMWIADKVAGKKVSVLFLGR